MEDCNTQTTPYFVHLLESLGRQVITNRLNPPDFDLFINLVIERSEDPLQAEALTIKEQVKQALNGIPTSRFGKLGSESAHKSPVLR